MSTFLMDEALLSISPGSRSQLMELLIEQHGIFGSNFAYLFFNQPLHGMQNVDTASSRSFSQNAHNS